MSSSKVWATRERAQSRFDICKNCDDFLASSSRCKRCGCFMKVKVKVDGAACPAGRW